MFGNLLHEFPPNLLHSTWQETKYSNLATRKTDCDCPIKEIKNLYPCEASASYWHNSWHENQQKEPKERH
jgi:hypothetical protein